MAAYEILVVTGPSASGKTAYALSLAERDPSIEIVNADASLVYRGFDIGTAKPSRAELDAVPHHLIDILAPNETYSAGSYSADARRICREIIQRGMTPVVVGGTGLYIDALFDGIMNVDIAPELLEEAKQRAQQEIKVQGFDVMHERLREIDPELFVQIRRERNPIRLERAWTHFYATGEPLGTARKREPEPFEYRPKYHVLSLPREELWRRIESRTDAMIEAGWLDEARTLKENGVTREMPAMRLIGYREMFDVLEGAATMDETRERIIIRTRQYAKRQVTWMKKYVNDGNTAGALG